jgi:REP element-mobilizing transposase RayT
MGLVYSHVVFALKNSRYDWQKIKRKKPVGYIAPTYPFFDGKEEEILVEEICNIASELDLKIPSLNFCGDHVHAIIIYDSSEISKLMLLWKGKSAYNFNKRILKTDKNTSGIITGNNQEGLWAKSYYQKIIKTKEEFTNVKFYIDINRKKHGLVPLTAISTTLILNLVSKNKID